MASSQKSERLGLSLWEVSDRPEWADFLQDNQNLESMVGGHLQDAVQHVTAEEKDFLARPFQVWGYGGSGSGRAQFSVSAVPKAVFVFAANKPASIHRSDGKSDVYWEFWIKSGTKEYGTGGIIVNQSAKSVQFASGSVSGTENSLYHRLNEKGVSYGVLML